MHSSAAFGSMWHPELIPSQMAKQREQAAASCRALSPDWLSHLRRHPEHGLKNCQQSCGASEPHQIAQLGLLHSSSCMAQKQSSQPMLSLTHLGTPCTRRQKPRKLEKMASI